MLVSQLNKIIALFLVGSVLLLWIATLSWDSVATFAMTNRELGNTGGAVAVGLLLLTASIFLGSVVEGLSDVSVRRWVRKSHRQRRWASFFGQNSLQDSAVRWEDAFWHLASKSDGYAHALVRDEKYPLQLATAVFFKNASAHHAEWVLSHYSTFVLATNYLLLSPLFVGLLFWKMAANECSVSSSAYRGSLLRCNDLFNMESSSR